MSQPGVSRAVRALEEELGGPLLHRSRAAARLTALGERALGRARVILAEADAMRQERDEQRGIARGRVRLGSMPSVSAVLLPGLLTQLERRHPALTVSVIEGHDDELLSWVSDDVVDVAVVVAVEDPELVQQPLLTDPLLAVVPAAHHLAHCRSLERRQLAEEPFILTRAGCERIVLRALAEDGVVPSVSFEVTEASSILAMVGEGLGVSLMPRLAALRPPSSVALRPLSPPAERRLSLATRAGRTESPALRAFLDEAAQWTPPVRRRIRHGRGRQGPVRTVMTPAR